MAPSPLTPGAGSAPPGGPTIQSAPPNFYAQAASAQQGQSAPPDYSKDNQTFRSAVQKLLTIYDKLEKLTPNGQKIDKDIKAMATTLKATRDRVFEGDEGEDEDQPATSTDSSGTGGDTKAAAGSAQTPAAPASATPAGAGA